MAGRECAGAFAQRRGRHAAARAAGCVQAGARRGGSAARGHGACGRAARVQPHAGAAAAACHTAAAAAAAVARAEACGCGGAGAGGNASVRCCGAHGVGQSCSEWGGGCGHAGGGRARARGVAAAAHDAAGAPAGVASALLAGARAEADRLRPAPSRLAFKRSAAPQALQAADGSGAVMWLLAEPSRPASWLHQSLCSRRAHATCCTVRPSCAPLTQAANGRPAGGHACRGRARASGAAAARIQRVCSCIRTAARLRAGAGAGPAQPPVAQRWRHASQRIARCCGRERGRLRTAGVRRCRTACTRWRARPLNAWHPLGCPCCISLRGTLVWQGRAYLHTRPGSLGPEHVTPERWLRACLLPV